MRIGARAGRMGAHAGNLRGISFRPYGAEQAVAALVPRVSSAAADFTLGYFRASLREEWLDAQEEWLDGELTEGEIRISIV
jgi:hypothetical protein